MQIAQHYQAVLQQNSAGNNSSAGSNSGSAASTTSPSIQLVQAGGQVHAVQVGHFLLIETTLYTL